MADEDLYAPGEDEYDEGDVAEEETLLEEEHPELANIRPELRRLYTQHPELIVDYTESIIPKLASKDNHKTYPFLTVYEKTKITGLRANQLSQGANPYIMIPEHITSVREIARLELEQKRLPFIVKRPLPNGKYEYWRVADLIIL